MQEKSNSSQSSGQSPSPSHGHPSGQSTGQSPVRIIAFDFDGTITTKDTFALFLRYWAGTLKWAFNIFLLLPIFALYGLGIIDRNVVKKKVVRRFFKNASEQEFLAKAKAFAENVIPNLIRDGALQTLKDKNKPPYTLYIVSASISPYLQFWAKNNNIDHVIATNLIVVNGRLTGDLDGENCWGPGKMAKISSLLAETPYVIEEAYGDSRGDREMLDAAHVSFWRPFRL